MRPLILSIAAAFFTAPAAFAQDAADFYTVNAVPVTAGVVQLQYVTTAQQPETCPLVPYDFYVVADAVDADGFVVGGVIDFTTTVPAEAQCLDQVGPWTGSLSLQIGAEFPQIAEGEYDVFIDDDYEGTLWVEYGFVEFTGDNEFILP